METLDEAPVWLAVWIRGMAWGAACGALLGVLSSLTYATDPAEVAIAFGYGAVVGLLAGVVVGLVTGGVLALSLRVAASATSAAVTTVAVAMTAFTSAAYGFWCSLPDGEGWLFILGGPALAAAPMTYTVLQQARRARTVATV
jgi:uncharacterized membrane protein